MELISDIILITGICAFIALVIIFPGWLKDRRWMKEQKRLGYFDKKGNPVPIDQVKKQK